MFKPWRALRSIAITPSRLLHANSRQTPTLEVDMSGSEVAGLALAIVPILFSSLQELVEVRSQTLRYIKIYGPLGAILPFICSPDAWQLANRILETRNCGRQAGFGLRGSSDRSGKHGRCRCRFTVVPVVAAYQHSYSFRGLLWPKLL